jgi:hypothetical protein
MPSKREPSSKRTATAERPPRRKPKATPELRNAVEQDRARAEQLSRLYEPLHEAGQAELEKTAGGRKMLEEARTLVAESEEIQDKIASGRTSFEEGQRLLFHRTEAFRKRHRERYLQAYGRYADRQPSVEAVAQILEPEKARDTVWVSETAFLQALLLTAKPAPQAVATVSQGLGDPGPPPPAHSCLTPLYGHREDGYGVIPPLGDGMSDANVNGNLMTNAMALSTANIPEFTRMEAWVGGDFLVAQGSSSFSVTVDYDWEFFFVAAPEFGLATASAGVKIAVDFGDGLLSLRFPERSQCLVTVAPWGNRSDTSGSETVTEHFPRDGSLDQTDQKVTVLVGLASDAYIAALGGVSYSRSSAFVREICLDSSA